MDQTLKAKPLKEKLTTLLSSCSFKFIQTKAFIEKLGEGRKYFFPNQMQICKQILIQPSLSFGRPNPV